MSVPQFDLIIRVGRLFCAETGLDSPGAIAIRGDRISAIGVDVTGEARETLAFPDDLLLPGLVDLHTHPAPLDWKYGIDPDRYMLARGTTTVLSQGDAGPATWPQYREQIIERAHTRVRLAINSALPGESREGPCFRAVDDVDVDACVAAIQAGGEAIWGLSVNVSSVSCPDADPREVLRRTLAAAERTDRPLLFGVRRECSQWPLAEQLHLLRPGDVVTYCFQAGAGSFVQAGRVVDAVREARERGVLFDVGHGMNSFDFGVAETAIAQGFPPDTISSDIYRRHLGVTPPHDLPRTISKLIAAGMAETEALARATAAPARVLGMSDEIGTLAPGACADLAVLRWNPDAPPLADAAGVTRAGGCWEPILTVRGGQIVQRAE